MQLGDEPERQSQGRPPAGGPWPPLSAPLVAALVERTGIRGNSVLFFCWNTQLDTWTLSPHNDCSSIGNDTKRSLSRLLSFISL